MINGWHTDGSVCAERHCPLTHRPPLAGNTLDHAVRRADILAPLSAAAARERAEASIRSVRSVLDGEEPEQWRTREAERIAQAFHETYERLAPEHGYETRKASAVPWSEVPPNNAGLMIAVCNELLERGVIQP
jgi:hypothetical protein